MKILVLDIETKPAKAYTFQAYDTNISPEQVIEPGGTICVGLKWFGDKKMYFFADWLHGHEGMLKGVYDMMVEADALVTFNGDRFDLPKLLGEFALAGFPPPPPHTSIDVLKAVKKFGLFMNRLAHVGPLFGAGKKLKHQGFDLWRGVMDGDPKCQKIMERYCVQDVIVLENLYRKIRSYIRNHPHMGTTKSAACGACGSTQTQSRGYRRTKAFRIQRIQCMSCGSWSDGRKEKMT